MARNGSAAFKQRLRNTPPAVKVKKLKSWAVVIDGTTYFEAATGSADAFNKAVTRYRDENPVEVDGILVPLPSSYCVMASSITELHPKIGARA